MRTTALLAALLLSSALGAQASSRPLQLVVSGGLSVPTGDFGDSHDLGLHADVAVLINALGSLRLRPELSYSRFKIKEALQGLGSLAMGARSLSASSASYGEDVSTLLGGFANVEFGLGSGAITPFLLAGVGAVSLESGATLTAESVKETKVSVNLGAGIRFGLGPIRGFVEGRLNNVPSDKVKTTFKEARSIPLTFGLVF
jgi:opacity protein-like surface antigen